MPCAPCRLLTHLVLICHGEQVTVVTAHFLMCKLSTFRRRSVDVAAENLHDGEGGNTALHLLTNWGHIQLHCRFQLVNMCTRRGDSV